MDQQNHYPSIRHAFLWVERALLDADHCSCQSYHGVDNIYIKACQHQLEKYLAKFPSISNKAIDRRA